MRQRRWIWITAAVVILAALGTAGYLIYRHNSNATAKTATASNLLDYRSSGLAGTGIVISQQSDTANLASASAGFKLFIWQQVTTLRALASSSQLAPSDVQKYQTATITVDEIEGDHFAVGSLSTTGQVLWANVNDTWKQISVASPDGKFDCTAVHTYSVPDNLTNGGQCANSNLIQS